MRRHFTRRNILLLIIILLAGGIYLYNLLPDRHEFKYTYIPTTASGSGTAKGDNTGSVATGASIDTDSAGISPTPAPTQAPVDKEASLNVRDTTIALGESDQSIISKLGVPGRIDDTEYDFDYYVYDNDYNRLLYVAIRDGKVVGFYTDSADFNYQGIYSGAGLNTVSQALKGNYSMSDIITVNDQAYTVHVLMDKLVTQKVTGIYVLDNSVKIDEYTDTVMKNVELMVYDLTNSMRVHNNKPVLSWSSSAALAARKHCFNMANNKFFSHIDPERQDAGDRLNAEGISYKSHAENIVAGYGTAILSVHRWFNSTAQRNNMLSDKFRYIGVGFAYVKDSTYETYITQDFYR